MRALRPLALAPALALALAPALVLAGCTVDVTPPEFHVRGVGVSSIAGEAWRVEVSFLEGSAGVVHAQTVTVPANGFVQLEEATIPAGDYTVVAATSAHRATRDMHLDVDVKGITVSVSEGGLVGISVIG